MGPLTYDRRPRVCRQQQLSLLTNQTVRMPRGFRSMAEVNEKDSSLCPSAHARANCSRLLCPVFSEISAQWVEEYPDVGVLLIYLKVKVIVPQV
ncbi:hypothetical protein TNCT_697551 [Trichonephila clavata]|uniref:Uncharacterized protein n=1 Tax=Trichonephila clavata TaxID=2740835 RepID=A0A8X6LD13_TRICU|nr:hypothetical protein TNCT_697551 [Trichonephila clavata]